MTELVAALGFVQHCGLSSSTIVFALAVNTSLRLAILADTGATLIVIANALRLLASPRTS